MKKLFCIAITAALGLLGCRTVGVEDLARNLTPKDLTFSIVKPSGDGPFPTVVLMHGCAISAGTRRGIKDHANYLESHGYASVILESGSVTGIDVCKQSYKLAFAREYRAKEALTMLKHLKTVSYVDQKNIFLMGQSNGAGVALVMGNKKYIDENEDKYKGVVAYYPRCDVVSLYDQSAPTLILIGNKDDWTPSSICTRTRNPTNVEVVVYEDALHSFDLPIQLQYFVGHKIGYNQKADQASKQKYLDFFEQLRRAD